MTAATTSGPAPVEALATSDRRRRRPVTRFLLAIGAVGLLLAVAAWSGSLWPQVRLQQGSTWVVGAVEPAPGSGWRVTALTDRDVFAYDLVNLGRTPVEVRSVVWAADRPHEALVVPPDAVTSPEPDVVTIDRLDPFVPFSVPGGATRTLAVSVPHPCDEASLTSPLPDVRVEVASPTGRVRTLVLSEGAGPLGPPPCG